MEKIFGPARKKVYKNIDEVRNLGSTYSHNPNWVNKAFNSLQDNLDVSMNHYRLVSQIMYPATSKTNRLLTGVTTFERI